MVELPSLRLFGLTAPAAPAEELRVRASAAFAVQGQAESRLVAADGAAVAVATAPGHWLATTPDGLVVALCGRPDLSALPPVDSADPASQLALAYSKDRAQVLQRLRGSFALAVIDRPSRQALLAVDRMGIESLCFAADGRELVFGTRADAVARALGGRANIDPQALFDYLFFHVVPAPGTIFRSVAKLLPGQYLEFRDGRTRTEFYWRMRYADRAKSDPRALGERLRRLLPEVVGRQADAGRVGAFLSGGTDSSTVAGTLAHLRAEPIDAYSIGFDAPGFDEMAYARIAARHFGLRHHPYYVTPADVVQIAPLIARAYDEPFGNASAVPTYLCAKLARDEGMPVLLAGDGGDELFGGNARYAKQRLFEAYALIPKSVRETLVEPLLAIVPGADRFTPTRKLRSYVQQARVPLPDRLEAYNFLVRSDLAQIFVADFLAVVRPEHPFSLMREIYDAANSVSVVNRMMHLDLKQTLADNDLRKVNVMCRLAGIDVRYPMLDDQMVALSAEVPPESKVRGTRLRPFFKDALRDFLPREILAKEKHGFGLPFGIWLRQHKPLYELAGDSLASFGRRRILRQDYLESLLSRARGGHASYHGVMIWVVLMLEQWLARDPAPATDHRVTTLGRSHTCSSPWIGSTEQNWTE